MSWQSDLLALLKGLEKVGQSLAKHQQKEVARQWRNSSIRTAVQSTSTKMEEAVSDVITKPDIKVYTYNRKLRTTMPSLKPPVEKMIRSGIVYKITCPRCTACYVGQSSRHLQIRIREHTKNPGPVKTHLRNCNTTITEEHIDILASTSRGEGYLLTLEALFIQELEPKINTKDEWRSRTLTIKI